MKNLILFVTLLFLVSSPFLHYGQIAQYTFDGSLRDNIEYKDATLLEGGQATTLIGKYTLNNDSSSIYLGPRDGILLPETIIQEIDTSESIEIAFTFKNEIYRSERSGKDLWASKLFYAYPGMRLFTRVKSDSMPNTLSIHFMYSDGFAAEGSAPNNNKVIDLGIYEIEQPIMVRFLIDFKNQSWHALIDGNSFSEKFDTINYDWEVMLNHIFNKPWHFGWHEQLRFSFSRPTGAISVYDLEFHSPGRDGF